jgi:hypothetical protein
VALGHVWTVQTGHVGTVPPLDSARWLWKSFPFSDLDSNCCTL